MAPRGVCASSLIAIAAVALAASCREPARPAPIRFLHTFGPQETELFNAVVSERGIAVEPSLVPFARGRQMITEILSGGARERAGQGSAGDPGGPSPPVARTDAGAAGAAGPEVRGVRCPDLVRIDATWLPGLVAGDLLAAPPRELVALDWLPEAAELAQLHGVWWGLPQAMDGLLVLRAPRAPAPPSPSLTDLVAAAEAMRDATRPFPLGVRVDGYWFVPWLRAEGGELTEAGLDGDGAVRAVTRLAALFGTLAPPPPPSGRESPDETRRWRDGTVAYWITGPWQLAELRRHGARSSAPPGPDGPEARGRDGADPHDGLADIAVSPLAGAPRGGQLLVVPRCADRPAEAWRLAGELTSVEVAARFSDELALVPTRRATLDRASPVARAAHAALRDAVMLPRAPVTPLLFDDLNPALAAVVEGDATAEEAVAGVRRGWRRLIQQVAR